jgi:hypothetical protein
MRTDLRLSDELGSQIDGIDRHFCLLEYCQCLVRRSGLNDGIPARTPIIRDRMPDSRSLSAMITHSVSELPACRLSCSMISVDNIYHERGDVGR